MPTGLLAALSANRPFRALLVGAPAVAGWLWGGGSAGPRWPIDLALVLAFAWLLSLASFLWNDRADVVRGTASGHRRASVRGVAGDPAAAGGLLSLGVLYTLLALVAGFVLAPVTAALGAVVAGAAWIYSDPVYFGKARPGPAAVLHGLGGTANAAAGAWAGSGEPAAALAWGLGCGALFTAAHLVHVVGDREEDRAVGVETAATRRSFQAAARGAVGALAGALILLLVCGGLLGGPRGIGLVVMAAAAAGLILVMARPPLSDASRWPRFQGRCRMAVAAGAAAGVGVTFLLQEGAA